MIRCILAHLLEKIRRWQKNEKMFIINSVKYLHPIAILGAGIEAHDIAAYLVRHGHTAITVCDEKAIYDGPPFPSGVQLHLGENAFANLTDFKTIFRSPGVRLARPELRATAAQGSVITSGVKEFFAQVKNLAHVIGVTGTKGKGTTTTLIGKILENHLQKSGWRGRVFIIGNIGNPPLQFIDDLTKDDWCVVELSSFQLQDLSASPHIAVVLNITSDHMDYHKDRTEYVDAKSSIVRYQKKSDFVVVNQDYPYSSDFTRASAAAPFFVSTRSEVARGAFVQDGQIFLRIGDQAPLRLCSTKEVGLIGPHNLENVTAAATAAALAGALPDVITEAIRTFTGLPHRLKFVRKIKEVRYYNDSFSTIPETCIAAIHSFTEPLGLILGGSEKNSDFTELGQVIVAQKNIKIVTLNGPSGVRVGKAIAAAGGRSDLMIVSVENLHTAVETMYAKMPAGSVVLLSPACASFNEFKNYKERGAAFVSLVLQFCS